MQVVASHATGRRMKPEAQGRRVKPEAEPLEEAKVLPTTCSATRFASKVHKKVCETPSAASLAKNWAWYVEFIKNVAAGLGPASSAGTCEC